MKTVLGSSLLLLASAGSRTIGNVLIETEELAGGAYNFRFSSDGM